MRNLLIALAIIIVLAVVGAYFLKGSSQSLTNNSGNTVIPTNIEAGVPVKTFTISAQNFSFSPSEIKVNKGDRVKIILNVVAGFHNWAVDEFNAKTEQVQGPATREVEFTADKAGTFEFYCSVGNHRQMGMVGNIIVE